MPTGAAPSTALERARVAYEQMQRREYNAAMKRRSRARTRNFALAVTFGSTLAIIIGLSIYNGWMPTPLRTAAQDTRADKTRTEAARTGHVRSFVKGNTCRELQFNNDSGTLVAGKFVPCEVDKKTPPQETPEGKRLDAIRDALKR
jgi:hypothetical protein